MVENNRQPFAEMCAYEARNFYPAGERLSKERVNAYFDTLQRFDLCIIQAALVALRERCKFFPSVMEIVEVIDASPLDRSKIAWETITRVIEEGEMCSIYARDKAMAYAIEAMGGGLKLMDLVRSATVEMWASYGKEFREFYQIGAKGLQHPSVQYFPGYAETYNREHADQLSQWANNTGRGMVNQHVLVVATDRYDAYQIPFDAYTMQMDAAVRRLLPAAEKEALTPYGFVPALDRPELVEDDLPVGPEERKKIIEQVRLLTAGSGPRDDGQASTADLLEATV